MTLAKVASGEKAKLSDMPEVHATRRVRLERFLVAREACAAIITRRVNVRYLTGLNSSNAALLVTAGGGTVLATDSRYTLAAKAQCPEVELVQERGVLAALLEVAGRLGVRRLLFEDHHLPVERYRGMTQVANGIELDSLARAVERMRQVKDDQEIAALEQACLITDQAFADVVGVLRAGMTEREIARALEVRMLQLGADAAAFEPIVASGPSGAVPHHAPTDRPLARGDLVTIDFGARWQGYHADMTRTVAIGEPAAWQRELYALVRTAQQAALEVTRSDRPVVEVDGAARKLIQDAGYGDHFGHGLGHGVGLEIHEAPRLGPDEPGTLADAVPITIEPGVYLPDRGGVRIEDTVVVRIEAPELLTRTTKELLVC